jgi:hypothetical protein
MHVHATMTLASGKDQEVTELLTRSLPLIAELGYTLAASFRMLNGPTRTILNLWEIPDANTFVDVGGKIANHPELLKILGGLEAAMIHNEVNLLQQTVPASPAAADAKAPDAQTVYLRETVTALVGQGQTVAATLLQVVPLLEKRGFRYLGTWARKTGPTRMTMNLWQLPPSASGLSIPDLLAEDAQLARAYSVIADACSSVEQTYLRKMPFSP